jgi:hypothetical protein
MSAAMITEFFELEALGGALFVFRRSVITILALRTLKSDDIPHNPTQFTAYD